MQVIGVNQYNVGSGSQAAIADFVGDTGVTFPCGDDLLDTYPALRAAAPGSSPNGVHAVVDQQGIIRYLGRSFESAKTTAVINGLLD